MTWVDFRRRIKMLTFFLRYRPMLSCNKCILILIFRTGPTWEGTWRVKMLSLRVYFLKINIDYRIGNNVWNRETSRGLIIPKITRISSENLIFPTAARFFFRPFDFSEEGSELKALETVKISLESVTSAVPSASGMNWGELISWTCCEHKGWKVAWQAVGSVTVSLESISLGSPI